MYAVLAGRFVDHGCFRHSVNVAVADTEAVATWFELGFGVDQIHGLRSTAPVVGEVADIPVRRALAWANDEGYQHCIVGWTSANLTSDAFWRRHGFGPVYYTLAREIDERVSWANERLRDDDLLGRW